MKKLKNFLYYEWKKILAIIGVILLVAVTVKQCSDKVVTDLGIVYIGDIKPENFDKLGSAVKDSGLVADSDNDGKTVIKTKEILIPQSEEIKLEQQVPQQIQFEVISGENLLYVIDAKSARTNAAELSFADITPVALKYNVPDDKCLKYPDGKVYAVSLQNNKLITELGIHSQGMYIAQRNYTEKDKDKILNVNARKAMEYILETSK